MKRLLPLCISVLIAMNLIVPTIDMAADLSSGSATFALASQPIMQYYAAVVSIPVKIVTAFLFDVVPGQAASSLPEHTQKKTGSAAARASSQFGVMSVGEKLRVQRSLLGVDAPIGGSLPVTVISIWGQSILAVYIFIRCRSDFWRYIRSRFIQRVLMPRGALDYAACMHNILFNGKPGLCFQ